MRVNIDRYCQVTLTGYGPSLILVYLGWLETFYLISTGHLALLDNFETSDYTIVVHIDEVNALLDHMGGR
jgi:hypothetical protein